MSIMSVWGFLFPGEDGLGFFGGSVAYSCADESEPVWQGSAGPSASAPAEAMPNVCFGKGSAWGAGQEPELFFACAGEAKKRASRGSLLWVHVV